MAPKRFPLIGSMSVNAGARQAAEGHCRFAAEGHCRYRGGRTLPLSRRKDTAAIAAEGHCRYRGGRTLPLSRRNRLPLSRRTTRCREDRGPQRSGRRASGATVPAMTLHTGDVRIGRVVVSLERATAWIRDYTNAARMS